MASSALEKWQHRSSVLPLLTIRTQRYAVSRYYSIPLIVVDLEPDVNGNMQQQYHEPDHGGEEFPIEIDIDEEEEDESENMELESGKSEADSGDSVMRERSDDEVEIIEYLMGMGPGSNKTLAAPAIQAAPSCTNLSVEAGQPNQPSFNDPTLLNKDEAGPSGLVGKPPPILKPKL
ncbi:hypothetical protein M5689_012987 [Euphorbia peplus]|nr:hypothetical protein M5689_012987 [Euphorbia peplus]